MADHPGHREAARGHREAVRPVSPAGRLNDVRGDLRGQSITMGPKEVSSLLMELKPLGEKFWFESRE